MIKTRNEVICFRDHHHMTGSKIFSKHITPSFLWQLPPFLSTRPFLEFFSNALVLLILLFRLPKTTLDRFSLMVLQHKELMLCQSKNQTFSFLFSSFSVFVLITGGLLQFICTQTIVKYL